MWFTKKKKEEDNTAKDDREKKVDSAIVEYVASALLNKMGRFANTVLSVDWIRHEVMITAGRKCHNVFVKVFFTDGKGGIASAVVEGLILS